ncbi:A-kinase anchor protein inhibitor 1 [Ochotona princeps]|uniref:A-kinase anchor protein inhibitor 1 n=1 Tax=Ochotona princeps TaxID=9978 RepID=UPI0027153590|nr:A-kinase anchor protein inhibitor 1 [Ochotona princeps]
MTCMTTCLTVKDTRSLGRQNPTTLMVYCMKCEKPGNEPEEVKLQNASRQIVQNAILQAVRQVSQESQRMEARSSDSRSRFQLGMGKLTKKHEKE